MKKAIILMLFVCVMPSMVHARTMEPRLLRDGFEMKRQATGSPSITPTLSKQKNQSIIDMVKNKIKQLISLPIHGKLTGIIGTTLNVTANDGKNWTVDVLPTTQLKRRFGGNAALEEFAVNDELAIVGRKHKLSDTEYSDTEIDAKYIRNLSIQKRNVAFNGNIVSVNGAVASFVLQTKGRGTQTVYKTANTLVKQKNTTISFDSLQAGDRVLVQGELWDRDNTKINAKTILKLAAVHPSPTNPASR